MRITTLMTAGTTLRDLNANLTHLSGLQQQLSSGKRITKPSDDPYGTSRALQLSSDVAGLQQLQRNVGDGTAWLQTADEALSKITDVVQRARELLVQGANDSTGPESRAAIAAEIDQLTDSIKGEANVRYAGHYIFSGTQTLTSPYTLGPASDAYGGDAGTVTRAIGPGVLVGISTDISALLGNGQPAADDKLLDTLRDIADDLRTPTTAARNDLRGTDLQRLDVNMDTLNALRADIGARTNRLAIADSRLQSLEQSSMQLLSETQDDDVAATLVQYSTQQAAYNAALRAGANIVQASLLDFLR